MEKKQIIFENVTKEFKGHNNEGIVKAVDNISLTINEGEFITLLGPSGCGKTTTLRMIAGFEAPTSGEIILGGDVINDIPPNKRDTSMVFQSYALFPHYSVYENISYGLRVKKMSSEEIKSKVEHIIDLVGLKGLENRNPGQLSGGQQQRVALARALVMEPSVLLFDEPLSNLDAKLRIYMRSEIRKIQRKLGLTSVYVTHDQTEAMSLSDRVIIMNNGKIEQVGTPEEIYQSPKTEFIADFIGTANFVEATITKVNEDSVEAKMLNQIVTINRKGDDEYLENEVVKVVVRPEAVEVGNVGKFSGKVLSSTYMGNVQEYDVEVDGIKIFIEIPNPSGKTIYHEDEQVRIDIKEESLHIIKISK